MARVFKRDPNKPDWWIDYNDVHGRRRREKVGPSQSLAIQVLAERIKAVVQHRELGIRQIEKTTFSKFAESYIENHAKPNKRSWGRDRSIIDNHLGPSFGGMFLSEISPRDIERYKAARAKKVSRGTVNRELACLKTILRKAVEWGNLRESPAAPIRMLSLENRRLVFLEREEIRNLLEVCGKPLGPIVETYILTGLRRSELLDLRWRDLDFRAGLIHVEKSKSGKGRRIPMNDRLRAIFRGIPRHIGGDYVFCRTDGRPWTDLRGSLSRAVERAGIDKRVGWHTLRHTFASQMVMSGADLLTISELMGHANIDMTRRYAHLSPDHKTRAMARLGEFLSGKFGTYLTPKEGDEKDASVSC